MPGAISAGQSRAARALLGWTRAGLARASGVPERTIAHFELETTEPRNATSQRLAKAFEAAGVIFLSSNGDGPGVRLRGVAGH
jgi:transcriptional regulator with XRE-family HTH domain